MFAHLQRLMDPPYPIFGSNVQIDDATQTFQEDMTRYITHLLVVFGERKAGLPSRP